MRKRILSMLLCIVLCLSFIPTMAFAATSYNVTFNANDGSGTMQSVQIERDGNGLAYFHFPKCEFKAPEGKWFGHWEVDGDATPYSIGSVKNLTQDVTVKPVWIDAGAETEYYTVTFLPNGGSGTMPKEQVLPSLAEFGNLSFSYYFPRCDFTAPSGYMFDKWEAVDNGVQYETGKQVVLFSSITVKPLWVEAPIVPTPTNPCWNGTIASWENVDSSVTYTAVLYKDGDTSEIAFKIVDGEGFVDFADAINQNGEGNYYFEVSGYMWLNNTDFYSETAKSASKRFPILPALQNVNISDKGILSWDAFPNAAKYTVAVSSNPIGPYWGVDTTELSNNLFDLCSRSNLTKGKTAYVKLAACGSDGNYISEEWIGEFLYPTTAQGCYYVTFESNGGGGEMPLTPVYANNTGFFFTLPQCEFTAPTGKKFDHWDVEGNCKQHSGGTELELFGNIILKPIWVDAEAGPEYFTVSFDANGGSGSMQDVQIPTVDGSFGFYTFPDCGFTAPEGKQFDHWKCLDSDVVEPGDEWIVLSNLVVKAVWKDAATPQPTTYTVSFNMNGRGNQVADQTINAGEKVTEPAEPTEIGYMFVGWYKDSEFNTAWNFDTDTVTADTTLYALWAKNIANYTVTFDMNGHGNQVEAQTVKEGEKAVKPADPTASGWTFGGWYKEAACSTAFSFDTAITANTKVYAKWTENTVKPVDPEKPNKPEKPEKPEKPVKPAKPGKPASPNTADTNQALLWVMLMILGGAFAGAELYSRKRKN